MRVGAFHLVGVGCKGIDEFRAGAAIEHFEVGFLAGGKGVEESFVSAGLDLTELGVREAFGEATDVGRERGFVAVGGVSRDGLAEIAEGGLLAKVVGGLLARGAEERGASDCRLKR